ncbi:MAG: aryl-sulfate sulfotransferase, partial [Aggregatilineales bacterium]
RRNNAEDDYGAYIMTVNNDGQPTFFQRLRGNRGFNFGRTADGQMYYGQVLDNGVGRGASMDSVFRVLDNDGEIVQEYQIVDGRTNPHEFILLDNGNVILISQPVEILDLTDYGGDVEAVTVAAIVQEIAPEGTIVFEWDSRDYFTVEDTAREGFLTATPPDPVPYIHVNGVAVANDGNWIISARRFDELIKIDRATGAVIWHMGGGDSKHNEFTFINDPMSGFSGQHHVQVLPNGNILLFDNGSANPIQTSRAVEYAIDEENRTATLVWSYGDGRYTPTLGSVQRLSNGNTLIGWGSAPGYSVTEVTRDGRVAFAMALPPTQMSYRAYRFEASED